MNFVNLMASFIIYLGIKFCNLKVHNMGGAFYFVSKLIIT